MSRSTSRSGQNTAVVLVVIAVLGLSANLVLAEIGAPAVDRLVLILIAGLATVGLFGAVAPEQPADD